MAWHPLDQALQLQTLPDGQWLGQTSAAYANMVGPYGGISAAQLCQALLLHPQRLGDPLSLTVNFCAPVADGAFLITARPLRTNRSTQHWWLEMQQDGQTVLSGTAVTAVRRTTWSVDEAAMPEVAPPEQCPHSDAEATLAFARSFEIRSVSGDWPSVWDGRESASQSRIWLRDKPARPLDYASLTSLADLFFPRIYLRRATLVPIGTVLMTVYFHGRAEHLVQSGDDFLLGQAYAHAFRDGFFDQSSQLWSRTGVLLASSHQVVYYKQ
jgi:acyl-CoA thioesterase